VAKQAIARQQFPVRLLEPAMIVETEKSWVVHFPFDTPPDEDWTPNTIIVRVDKGSGSVTFPESM
jgi:hypothetical protein